MIWTIAKKSQMSDENLKQLKEEMIEKLITASRYEEAGDLVDPQTSFGIALDCYLKANNY
jgi:hypothetical protein